MDELRLACKLVLLGTVYFSPLIVPSTVIIYLFMRRGPQRLAVLSRKRVATLAIVAAIPLAFRRELPDAGRLSGEDVLPRRPHR